MDKTGSSLTVYCLTSFFFTFYDFQFRNPFCDAERRENLDKRFHDYLTICLLLIFVNPIRPQ